MPALGRGPDQRRVGAPRFGLGQGLFAHPFGDFAPFAVQLVKAVCQGCGLAVVGGGEKAGAEVGLADPAARIDARSQKEAKRIGGRGGIHPGHIGQRAQPRPFAPRHHLQPLPHQRPVHPGQRRHIGDGRQRHQIKKRHQIRGLRAGFAQLSIGLDQHQEDDGGRAEMGQAAVFVLPVRVHHGMGCGQGLGRKVVVEDNHIGWGSGGNRIMRERAAIDADDQRVICRKPLHGRDIRAVAFVDAVRDIERGLVPQGAQPDDQQGGRGPPVDVVIGKDGDPFAGGNGGQKAAGGLLHVAQAAGIGQQLFQRGGQKGLGPVGGDAAGSQDAAQRQRQAGLLGDGFGQTVLRGVRTGPAAAGQRGGDIEESGHCHGSGVTEPAGGCKRAVRRARGPSGAAMGQRAEITGKSAYDPGMIQVRRRYDPRMAVRGDGRVKAACAGWTGEGARRDVPDGGKAAPSAAGCDRSRGGPIRSWSASAGSRW
ncbi:hypothetical protein MASR1M32_16590 [Rhodobacter sp.]